MNRLLLLFITLFVIVLYTCDCAAVPVKEAVCTLKSTSAATSEIKGTLVLTEFDNGDNLITGTITGLDALSDHGFHVHVYGDVGDNASGAAGAAAGHFTLAGQVHNNDLSDANRHTGDMGNITADANGSVTVNIANSLWKLTGESSVIGRAIILHQNADNGTPPTGAAGGRIAGCVIGIKNVNATEKTNNAVVSDNITVGTTMGICRLVGETDSKIKGVLTFKQNGNQITIAGNVCGLPDGSHGIHVHQFGDLSGSIELNAGHYNPQGVPHDLPSDADDRSRHAGDFGNFVSTNGNIEINKSFNTEYTTITGATSIIGRSVIVHLGKDQGKEFQPAGESGAKVAKCIIGLQASNADTTTTMTCDPLTYVRKAVCSLVSTTSSPTTIAGTLYLEVSEGIARISGNVTGLAANSEHGFHVHQYGDLSKADGSAAMGHYNPTGATHGSDLTNNNRHVGDMGNIMADANGVAHVNITDQLWTLNGNDNNVVGRAIIIHELRDDGNATNNGNAGKRFAMCVIGVQNAANNLAQNPRPNGNALSTAAAEIRGVTNINIFGRVTFTEVDTTTVDVKVKICGVPNGPHGFHVHQFGDVSNLNVENVGSHFDPEQNPHRYPDNADRHVGDMGNVTAVDGVIEATFRLDRLTLTGANSILGRGVILHSGADAGVSQQPAGNSGSKLAVGLIGLTPSTVNMTDISCPQVTPSPSPVVSKPQDSADDSAASSVRFFSVLLMFVAIVFK
jgi:Cu-Zn family superoxide dismutase